MCCFNKLKCRRNAAQKSLAEFAARRLRIRFDPFFAAAPPKGTSVGRVRREKYFALASAQRNWPRQTRRLMSGQSVFSRILCVKTRGSERKLFCQKRAPPFFDKLSRRISGGCACITGSPWRRLRNPRSCAWPGWSFPSAPPGSSPGGRPPAGSHPGSTRRQTSCPCTSSSGS